MSDSNSLVPVPVWDLPTRLFPWILVGLVAASAITGEFAEHLGSKAMEWHKLSGFAILALLLFRLGWGVMGGTYARFANFVRGPRSVLRYLEELAGRRAGEPHVGHNPLGGWSVVLMILALCVQTGTGLFLADEDLGVEGPLAKLVSRATSDRLGSIHEANFAVIAALVCVHLGAIAFYFFAKGENLVRPMVFGVKQLPTRLATAASRGGSAVAGLVLLAIAAGLVYLLVTRV